MEKNLTYVDLWLIHLKCVSLEWFGAFDVDDGVNLIRKKVACYNIMNCIFTLDDALFLVSSALENNCTSLMAIERKDEKEEKG